MEVNARLFQDFVSLYMRKFEVREQHTDLEIANDRNPATGTFANYIIMKGDLTLKIPPTMSFENAATLPCGLATVGLGFYKHLEIPFLTYPVEPKTGPFILIYGGSSATGSLGIQVAKLYVDFSFIFFQDLYVARDFG